MTKKAIICQGDTTTHGGRVIEGSKDRFMVKGKKIACIGHLVSCPECKGVYPIIEGENRIMYHGKAVAVEGMSTACGAKLNASQQLVKC